MAIFSVSTILSCPTYSESCFGLKLTLLSSSEGPLAFKISAEIPLDSSKITFFVLDTLPQTTLQKNLCADFASSLPLSSCALPSIYGRVDLQERFQPLS